jgi:hypothetical protein
MLHGFSSIACSVNDINDINGILLALEDFEKKKIKTIF